ncbi:MAG: hypothetical protein KBD44_00175 [Candidatus Pacebacteria bacterium]|nr:hypothetical protein [Candidatus Paceibacterota bacterium]
MFNIPVLIGSVLISVLVVFAIILAILYRKVVSTNMVHIVQRGRTTMPYGTGLEGGNVYYRWPSWIPKFGVTVIELPVSNFDLSLDGYEAYDADRVPFMVDVTAFFRIDDTALAAQRVASIAELDAQLRQIVQGAVRKVLAGDKVDNIMLERSKFGEAFTAEVVEQLKQWGVEPVKSMELMDIRDGRDSKVISNIMAKKTSQIDMESRVEVANNKQKAETAEIDAQQAIDIRAQDAAQAVGQRTAEAKKQVGIADEQAQQEIKAQAAVTMERQMGIVQVEQVRQAEITKAQQVVAAEQDRETTVIIADGQLEAERKRAQGIEAVGVANAAAEKAMQLAPVEAQIVLAKEIGGNVGYQQYLMTIEGIKGYVVVGGKQAEALQKADIKVIANTGKPGEGMTNVMDLFTSKGGTHLASAVEAFAQSPLGQAIVGKVTNPAPAKVTDTAPSGEGAPEAKTE